MVPVSSAGGLVVPPEVVSDVVSAGVAEFVLLVVSLVTVSLGEVAPVVSALVVVLFVVLVLLDVSAVGVEVDVVSTGVTGSVLTTGVFPPHAAQASSDRKTSVLEVASVFSISSVQLVS